MTIDRSIKNASITTIIFYFFLFIPSLSFAVNDTAAISVNQATLTAQGKVERYNHKKQLITLKTSKGEKMSMVIGWNTALVGYSSLQEIEKEQGIKIWYTIEVEKKIAIKIERKLDVGC